MNKRVESDICEFLPWDTDFFGFRIARVKENYITEQSVKDILEWIKNNSIDCLYFLAGFNDPKTIELAHIHDFQLVDIRVTFECDLEKQINEKIKEAPANNVFIRPAQVGDISKLESIARTSYDSTRFHFDENFPKEKSDTLYEIWIRRSCEGYADQVLVAEVENQAAGYITLKLLGNRQAQIGLIGVSDKVRGQGIGKSLIYAAFDWSRLHLVDSMFVVTQGRNIIGQNLYQKCGFTTKAVQIWYHKWLSSQEANELA